MIRLVLAILGLGMALGFAPAAIMDPVFNGADLAVVVALVLLLGCLWPSSEWVEDAPVDDPPSRLDVLDERGRG